MLLIKPSRALQQCLKTATCGGATDPVESIAVIGGFVKEDAREELSGADELYLRKITEICAEKSIAISPDVQIGVANLHYGRHQDFLVNAWKADLVVFSYLYFDKSKIGPHSDHHDFFTGTLQSPLAADPDNWHDALVKTGARYAFNIVSCNRIFELPTEFLARPPFEKTDTVLGTMALEYDLLMR